MKRNEEVVVSSTTISYPSVRACKGGKRMRVTSLPESGRKVGKGRFRRRNISKFIAFAGLLLFCTATEAKVPYSKTGQVSICTTRK